MRVLLTYTQMNRIELQSVEADAAEAPIYVKSRWCSATETWGQRRATFIGDSHAAIANLQPNLSFIAIEDYCHTATWGSVFAGIIDLCPD